jgi:putative membrane protein
VKTPEEHLKRWLHPAVFAAWTVYLIYLLVSQRYTAFLRLEFGLLLAFAHFIAMGLTMAAMLRPKTAKMDLSGVFRATVLLVPILYSMVMPDAMLGNQAFKKRFVGTTNAAVGRKYQSMPASQGTEADPDLPRPPGDIEGARQERSQERTILEIFLNPNFYNGHQVIVTGMILRDDQLKPYFGGRNTAVYRFWINCCAADAQPLAIALDSDQTEAFANDQWVQVEGTFELRKINGKLIPIVLKPRIKPSKAPSIPYLF